MVVSPVHEHSKTESTCLLRSEISSWIHDEDRCVTVPSISWTWGMSRGSASQALMDAIDIENRSEKSSFSSSFKNKNPTTNGDKDLKSVLSSSKQYNAICIQSREQSFTHEEIIPETGLSSY
jgi:hypothetical protein